jgi:transposase-like protein
LGLALHIQLSSLRRAARALSEIHRVYPSRNALAAEQFIREVLKYCDGKPTFIVDSAPWLRQALEEMGLTYNAESFRR